ncbi:MAG: hypothetical protein QM438_10045 [Euryarchaeota archaeon]|nr:hypothetical protein [Euryarchaeota archaeon]
MLSPSEKEQFKMFESLDPKVRSNLVFRISKKIKKCLADLDEIDEVLRILPERTARRLLTDDMVNATFTLSETMIKIMGYAPVISRENLAGRVFIERRGPPSISKDGQSMKFEGVIEPATLDDIARKKLVEDHIDVLTRIMNSDSFTRVLGPPHPDLAPIEYHPVTEKLERWGRRRW